jgi:threonyl-tRNA synthetase
MAALPGYIVQRNELFQELWQKYKDELQQKERPEIDIEILQDEKEPLKLKAKAWETTPAHLLKHLDKAFTSQVVVAKVDDELWDLDRPFEKESKVSYVPFSATEGRMVFWHSSAHVLGEACECHYHAHLSHGPPVAEGFFYDMRIGEG